MTTRIEQVTTRLTAYDAFRRLGRPAGVALLESCPGGGPAGRYSILGFNPYQTLRGWTDFCCLDGQICQADVFRILDQLLAGSPEAPWPELPIRGGCVGTIAYDAGFRLVDLPLPLRSAAAVNPTQPLVSFDFYDNWLVFDQQTGTTWIQACGRLEAADRSLARLRRLLAGDPDPVSEAIVRSMPAGADFSPLPDRGCYLAQVEAIREQIRSGNVYIANLTDQLSASTAEPAEQLYARLRRINPAPYAAFVRQDNLEILSASPERFIRISPAGDCVSGDRAFGAAAAPRSDFDRQRRIETCPIKGTRPRGHDAATDAQYARDLLASVKDRSELLMIVDLERNDLSRVCRPDSIMVPELFRLETYPSVFHLAATVQGILRDDVSAVQALTACFPGGSISGAPKVAAMQVIDALERQPRYWYTGCLGYFSFDGQAEFNILIRSIIKQGPTVRYGSGGGITWESDAAAEYEEMLVKAESFRRVLDNQTLTEAGEGNAQ